MRALILKIIEGRGLYINGDFTGISNNEMFDRLNNQTKKTKCAISQQCRLFQM